MALEAVAISAMILAALCVVGLLLSLKPRRPDAGKS